VSAGTLLAEAAAQRFRLGEQAQLDERYADASGHYEAVLRLAPDFEPARFNHGVSELRRGQAASAVEAFEALLEAYEEKPKASGARLPLQFNLAYARACDGDAAGAYEVARELVLAVAGTPATAHAATQALAARMEGPAMALLAAVSPAPAFEEASGAPPWRPPSPSSSRDALVRRLETEQGATDGTVELAAAWARRPRVDEPRTTYLLACYDARFDPRYALGELEDALVRDPASIEWARRDALLDDLRARTRGDFHEVIRWARVGAAARSALLGGTGVAEPLAAS
jgi:tetratricopeptide (TPR) repeat protein